METIILVDEKDNPIGTGEKMEVHKKGLLHRCFSIFILNSSGELLLQRRALDKYHSGGLWANTCCSHPRLGESDAEAAKRRLREEMGISCELSEIHTFIYKAELDHGITEHEFDHVMIGKFAGTPSPDPNEVMEWKWIDLKSLQKEITDHPESFAAWLKILMNDKIFLEKIKI